MLSNLKAISTIILFGCRALFGVYLVLILIGCHPIYYFTDKDNGSLQPSITLEQHRPLTITVDSLSDPQQLLEISTRLVSETTMSPIGVLTEPVTFPSGDKGMFVALGYQGIARGYQLLYRVHDDVVELVESKRSNVVWGTYDLDRRSKIESLCLLNCKSDQHPRILKIVGGGHSGTGLFANGIFELIQVADDGLNIIFNDFEENWVVGSIPGSYHEKYQYEFLDVASEPNKVILKRGQFCEVVTTDNEPGLRDVNCTPVMRRFTFDGNQYKWLMSNQSAGGVYESWSERQRER